MVSEKIRRLYYFFESIETVNIALSVIFNVVLILLILYRTPKVVGSYRHLLVAFTINDIYFAIVHYLTMPVACSYNDAFIMFSHGLLTSKFSICLYACAYSQTMPLLAHLFIYRLVATKRSSYLQFYNARTCFLLVAVTLGVESTLWFFNCYFNYATDLEIRHYVQPFLNEYFDGHSTDFIGALYYSAAGQFRMKPFLATMGFNAIMFICLFIIVTCSVIIVSHFRKTNIEWSGKTKQMQKQLFTTLFVQTAVPMIFVYLPCAGVISLPMFGWRIAWFPNLITTSVTAFPLLDAFVLIIGIRSYRESVLSCFACFTPSSNEENSIAIDMTTRPFED